MSNRAVLHSVLALGLIGVLIVKILIVQFYREFMRFVPTLGIVLFILAFVVFFTSAGYYFLMGASGRAAVEASTVAAAGEPSMPDLEGDAAAGEAVFTGNCASCHAADTEDWFMGPGLKGVLARETLSAVGKPATLENVWVQIVNPVGTMPAFTSFSDREMADLLAYMETL
jgi:mono/diheme cytochrome c family protein